MNALRYPLSTIADAVGGKLDMLLGDDRITSVSIDSRSITSVEGALFIALKGPRHDGHAHIAELARRGIRNVLVQEGAEFEGSELNVIVVPDTLQALQRFAAWHRAHFHIPVIGITGSNGKTIVKEWLWQMLHHEETIVRNPGSWNSQVGVPLSVLRMGPEHTLGIFEAGISKPGEMEKLEPIVRPTIGVLTNIGDAHDEGFGGDRGLKEREKRRLFTHADVVLEARAFLRVHGTRVLEGSCEIDVEHPGVRASYLIPFDDQASIENALTCIAVCVHLGRTPDWIRERLAQLVPVDMRMRTLQGAHGITLIDDSYSLDRTSLLSALDHLHRVAHGRFLTLVLSDVPERGSDATVYPEVAQALRKAGVRQLVGIGPAITAQGQQFDPSARFYPDVEAMLASEDPKNFSGSVVLVKGARRFGFERIVQRWQQQVHGTELEIDLEAVRHNLNHYRSLLTPGVRTMAMVKAFGYGSGALELARLFEHERVHYLGVAYADEGIELRSQGITMPIMVMNPEPVAMETLHRFRLETEVYDLRSLNAAIAAAERMPDAPPIHLKLDTGMHRLGFARQELPALLDALRDQRALKVASILSHLAASEDPAHDAFTREQIDRFTRMATAIGQVLGYKPLWHIANSAGIARWPQAHFDMVRLGIGLHGIGVNDEETAKLVPTVTLRTVIAQVKTIAAGESVSYGRRYLAQRETRIATLPIGYADGLSRRLGNGVGKVWIKGPGSATGSAAPFVGSICMDMCMVDVTGLDCSVEDEAILFGPDHPLQDYARDLGTIPYEALTSISQRVRRVYVRG